MGARAVRGRCVGLATVALLAGCTPGIAGGYPLPDEPPHAAQFSPATVGDPRTAVVIYIQVRPGDRIELVGAEAIGTLDGADVSMLVSRPVIEADGDQLIGKALEPLEGAVLTAASASPGPDNDIGIVAQLTADHPGRYKVDRIRLRYRLNGGPEQLGAGIDNVWTVCADDPAPADCPEEAPS